jgi:hypothetical protein
LIGAGRGPARGAPSTSGGGHRDRCAGEVAALWERRVRRRATARWGRGGKHLSWLRGGSAPDLAVAAAGGGHGRSMERGVARHGMRRAAALLWVTSVPACDQKIDGDVSRCMRRPRQECTTGEAWNRPAVRWALVRPAGAQREEGGLRGGLGTVRGFGEWGLGQCSHPRSANRRPGRQGGTTRASARRRRTGDVVVGLEMLDWLFLSDKTQIFATKVH